MPRKKHGTRRNSYYDRRKRNASKNRLIAIFRRFGLLLALVVIILWLGAWFVLSGAMQKTFDWLYTTTISESSKAGVQVRNILIEGRQHTEADLLRAIIDKDAGDPLLSFDPAHVRHNIEQISWVKAAQVERRLPDTIYIRLSERKPYALWRHDDDVSVIDREGVVLSNELKPEYQDLLVITGKGSAEHAASLIDLLRAEADIYRQTDGARFISGRRWDLEMKNGMTINLPAEDVGLALRRLADAAGEERLLEKDVTTIDLREPDRMIVEGR